MAYRSVVLEDGPAAYWRLGDPTLVPENAVDDISNKGGSSTSVDYPQRGNRFTTDRQITVTAFRCYMGMVAGTSITLRIVRQSDATLVWSGTDISGPANTWNSYVVPDVVLPAGTYDFTLTEGNVGFYNTAPSNIVNLGAGLTFGGGLYGAAGSNSLALDAANIYGYVAFEYTWDGGSTTAVDETGTHHGTYVGSPTLGVAGALTGDTNTAVDFPPSAYVSIPDISAARTYEIWFFLDVELTSASTWRGLWSGGNATNYIGMGDATGSVAGETMVLTAGNTSPDNTIHYITDNIPAGWVHAVWMWTGSAWRCFVNGTERTVSATAAHRFFATTAGHRVGEGGGASFDGRVDEVAIYAHNGLTPDRIARHYHHGLGKVGFDLEMLSSRPVSWWKLEEAAGATTATDQMGAHHGTYGGTPTFGATGIPIGGTAVDFSGDDEITTGWSSATPAITLEAWVNTPSPTQGSGGTAPGVISGDSHGNIQWNGGADPLFQVRVGGADRAVTFGPLTANTWHHLVGTFDGSTVRAYKDGELVASLAASGSYSAGLAWRIGSHAWTGAPGRFYVGKLDEVAIYDRALPAWEIRRHYQRGIAVFNAKHDIVLRDGAALWLDAKELPSIEVAQDDFNRADSTTGLGTATSGHAWSSPGGGTFGITGNRAYWVSGGSLTDTTVTIDSGVSDGTIEVDVLAASTAKNGIAFREVDYDDHFLCFFLGSSGEVQLWRVVAQGYAQLGTAVVTTTAGAYHRLRVDLAGSSIKVFLDGVEKISVTDTNHQTATRHGLHVSKNHPDSRWDNFSVQQGKVATWKDATGNARNAVQATAAAQPMLVESVLGTQPVVRFDGVDDRVATAAFTTMSQPNTVVLVFSWANKGAASFVFDGIASANRHSIYNLSGGAIYGYATDTAFATFTPTLPLPVNTWVGIFNGGSSTVRHGSTAYTGAVGAGGLTGLTVGSTWDGFSNFQGDIAEVMVFDRVLLAHELKQIETDYLARRYGIGTTQVPVEEIESGTYTPPLRPMKVFRGGSPQAIARAGTSVRHNGSWLEL